MQKKIFLWFVLIVVLPSGIIFFIANHLLIQFVVNQQVENNNQLIKEMRKNLDTKLLHYQQLTMQFYLNDLAMREIQSDEEIRSWNSVQSQLDRFVNSNRLISSAYLISDKGVLFSGTGIQEIEGVVDEIEPTLLSLEGRIYWSKTYPLVTNFGLEESFFFGLRHIRVDQKPIATLLLAFNTQFFDDFFQFTPFSENQLIRLTDENETLIASNHVAPFLEKSGKKGRFVTLTSLSTASDWKLELFLDTQEISSSLTYVRDIFNLSAILYILFFLMISLLVSKLLTKPILELTSAVQKVGEGFIDVQVDIDHIDEIKQLSIGFNAMTDRIQKLLNEVKHEEENKRKAYMQTLQLQLTPHLLYNSLNTIRWMAQINGQENIREITQALTRYLRSLSDIESEYITLKEELELVKDYAVIQRYRYSDFSITHHIPTSLLACRIHKLMVVNLVENSIIHGIVDRPTLGEITITAKVENEILYVTVCDNGVGIPKEVILSLEKESFIQEEESSHTGLRNIQNRLHLYHGKEYGLIIESEEMRGSSITIPIPLKE